MYLFLKIYQLYFYYIIVLLSDLLDMYEYKFLKYLQICGHMLIIITPKKWVLRSFSGVSSLVVCLDLTVIG